MDEEAEGALAGKAILEAVDNQLRDGEPPEAREALTRLIAEGTSEDDAKILIGRVLAGEMFEIMRDQRPHDEAKYVSGLKALPNLLYEEES